MSRPRTIPKQQLELQLRLRLTHLQRLVQHHELEIRTSHHQQEELHPQVKVQGTVVETTISERGTLVVQLVVDHDTTTRISC